MLCGVGAALSEAETRAMMLLRAGMRSRKFERRAAAHRRDALQMLNAKVHPVIPRKVRWAPRATSRRWRIWPSS